MTRYAGVLKPEVASAFGVQDPPSPKGKYTVVARLASGAMGEVVRARCEGEDDEVVIKRMHRHCASDPALVEMFHHEARLLAAVDHPGVVRLREFARDAEGLMLVLEHVAGADLAAVMHAHPAMTLAAGVEVVRQLLDALAVVHGLCHEGVLANVVHGDVAPANVRITPEGAVKLMDFGIATSAWRRDPDGGQMKGTRGYMAPEVITGERAADERVDLFAAAVVLYELTTGRRLYEGTAVQVMTAIVEAPVAPPSTQAKGYPEALEAVVLRALSRRAEDRYATAEAMSSALANAVTYDRAEARRALGGLVTGV